MAEIKTAKIIKCVFSNDWQNPSGGTTYYHELTMDNLDIGMIGKFTKYPKELQEGNTLTYTIDEKKKIKIVSNSIDNTKQNSMSSPTNKVQTKNSYNSVKKQDDFLGYAWSYAKDMIVAGKTMKDVDELNKMARFIYQEIGKMLRNEDNN